MSWPRSYCSECLCDVVFDDVFGWLHEDFAPRGASFDHRAVPLLASDQAKKDGGDGRP